MPKPVFISFDGIDGTGKSTQCRLLLDWLATVRVPATACTDPGGTALGQELRKIVLFGREHRIATTTEAMLPYLGSIRGLTVLTNSLPIVTRLSQYPDVAVVVLGGLLRRQEMSLLGHLTIAGLDEFGIDQVFTGAFGIDPEIGLTGTNLGETQTDRSLIGSARELILLADHSKLLQRGPARLAPTTAITTLVTDDGADADILSRFRDAGVTVETC